MIKARSPFAIVFLLVLAIVVIPSACRPRRSANEKRYPISGKVVAVSASEHTITLAHEDIIGYMPAMTMPFNVKKEGDLQMVKPGDQLTGTLVVDDLSSWVEITSVIEGGPPISPNANVPGEPPPGTAVPSFGLVNQDGNRIHLADYRGKTLLITFVYTRCPLPEQCTLMSNNFATIDKELKQQPDLYDRTHLLTISFDPDYDTPKVMRSYGASHTGRYSDETFQHWEFATGSKDEVKGIAQFFGLRYFHDAETGDDQVMHTLRTAIVGGDGKLLKLYRGNEWKPEEVLNELRGVITMPPPPSPSPK